ncbi:PLP-dependent aminotransferase family protein [Kitasatospora sp. RB6PN24]|uniref:aminotransferase-like domain-containing protein n=1 Tax=Kitasatospora humi TaxID=2893891 RepID=UPI001E3FDAE2|nr:PLP-dependent aminotransferase family protein [Kitasatospora humi]MCC9305822.1 PLP-dependent aminotransferase family protein [Kitasatospora humi]
MDDYRAIADEIAARIADGRLRPGEQLPTQRSFARARRIANSTAGRVYRELVRRQLVVGEVGRGTFVRAAPAGSGSGPALAEPAAAPVDLELNYPVVPEQSGLLAAGLTPLLRAEALEAALRPIGVTGTPAARRAFVQLVAWPGPAAAPTHPEDRPDGPGAPAPSNAPGAPARLPGPARPCLPDRPEAPVWCPPADAVLFAGSGRQAIAAALAALVPPGQRLGVEALTYPVVKAVARQLGITLVPLPVDDRGLRPEALAAVHRTTPLRALYLQPRLQNPLGATLPAERRLALAAELRRLDLPVVEDAIWAFLHPDQPPFAAYAPERTILADSLAKRLAPGLSTGFAVVPEELREPVAAALRSGAWAPGGLALEAAVRWIGDGTVAAVAAAKRADARERQLLARRLLSGFRLRADPCSYYVWWELPTPWRAEAFVAAAAGQGIAVTPAAAFAVDPRSTPAAVRVGLGSPQLPVLAGALETLARIARGGPEQPNPSSPPGTNGPEAP